MRTERSTTSGENFGDFLIAPFSNEAASSKPGAIQLFLSGTAWDCVLDGAVDLRIGVSCGGICS